MTEWDSRQYLRFERERTLPCIDLIRRIELSRPARVVDLGCGPGNSTAALAQRWPEARLTGVDRSPEMLRTARASTAPAEWITADLTTWEPDASVDLVFSNAALQWIPDHPRLIPRLWSWVAPRGALAFQVPAPGPERARWADAVEAAVAHSAPAASSASDASDAPVRPLSDYYAFLRAGARQIELWDTLYVHVLPDARAIVEWLQGTALRPQLALLPEPAERERFLAAVADEVARRYAPSPDGTVLFPFLRRFVIAYRG